MSDQIRSAGDRNQGRQSSEAPLWVVVTLLGAVAVGGMAYGLSYPSMHRSGTITLGENHPDIPRPPSL